MKKGYVYLLSSYHYLYDDYVYKIGFTKNKVNIRKKVLECGNPNDINVVYIYESKITPIILEKRLHRRYKSYLIKGEWYNLPKIEVDTFVSNCKFFEDSLLLCGFK